MTSEVPRSRLCVVSSSRAARLGRAGATARLSLSVANRGPVLPRQSPSASFQGRELPRTGTARACRLLQGRSPRDHRPARSARRTGGLGELLPLSPWEGPVSLAVQGRGSRLAPGWALAIAWPVPLHAAPFQASIASRHRPAIGTAGVPCTSSASRSTGPCLLRRSPPFHGVGDVAPQALPPPLDTHRRGAWTRLTEFDRLLCIDGGDPPRP